MITDDFKKPKEPFFATTQTNNSYLCVFNAMARIFHIVFLTALGFFLTPTLSYACDSKSEKIETICNKQSDSEIQKKDCCNEENVGNTKISGMGNVEIQLVNAHLIALTFQHHF